MVGRWWLDGGEILSLRTWRSEPILGFLKGNHQQRSHGKPSTGQRFDRAGFTSTAAWSLPRMPLQLSQVGQWRGVSLGYMCNIYIFNIIKYIIIIRIIIITIIITITITITIIIITIIIIVIIIIYIYVQVYHAFFPHSLQMCTCNMYIHI